MKRKREFQSREHGVNLREPFTDGDRVSTSRNFWTQTGLYRDRKVWESDP